MDWFTNPQTGLNIAKGPHGWFVMQQPVCAAYSDNESRTDVAIIYYSAAEVEHVTLQGGCVNGRSLLPPSMYPVRG